MKNALITGANRGIGAAIANALEAKGFEVIRTAREIPQGVGDGGHWVQLDVTSPDSIAEMALQVGDYCGSEGLQVLVNNAAVLLDPSPGMEDLQDDLLQRTLDVNLFGPLRVTRALLPYLRRSGTGAHIIHLSSRAGQLSAANAIGPAYGISKTALNALTVQQAIDWKAEGIRVNCMSPGWVRTDMGGSDAPLTPEQGADTAVWLATEAPSDLTGRFFADRTILDW